MVKEGIRRYWKVRRVMENRQFIKRVDVRMKVELPILSSDPALNGAVNTHRVVAVKQENGHYTYQTKGDGNNAVDPYEAEGDYLLGTVVASSLFLGKLVRLVSNPLIFIPIIIIPLVVMLLVNLIHTISYAKKIAKEEEEAAVREIAEQIKKKAVKDEHQKDEHQKD